MVGGKEAVFGKHWNSAFSIKTLVLEGISQNHLWQFYFYQKAILSSIMDFEPKLYLMQARVE